MSAGSSVGPMTRIVNGSTYAMPDKGWNLSAKGP
jgi:hypothetical protein